MKRKVDGRPTEASSGFIGEMNMFKVSFLTFSFLFSALLLILSVSFDHTGGVGAFADFEIGREAPRDLVLNRDFVFLDYEATSIKKQSKDDLIVPVFRYREEILGQVREKISLFQTFVSQRRGKTVRETNAPYDDLFTKAELDFLLRRLSEAGTFALFRKYADEILSEGYFLIPEGFGREYPKGFVEVVRPIGGKVEAELVDSALVVTRKNLKEKLTERGRKDSVPFEQIQAICLLAFAFLKENVAIDDLATKNRKEKIRSSMDPVFKRIPQGTVLVSEGQVVTENDVAKIHLLKIEELSKKSTGVAGMIAYLAMLYGLAIALLRPPMLEKGVVRKQFILIVALDLIYFVIAMGLQWFFPLPDRFPFGVLLPSALVAIFISVLVSYRASIVNTAILSLGQILVTGASPESVAFVFFSGVVGARIVRSAEERMDLIRAGVYLSISHGIAAIVLSFLGDHSLFVTLRIFAYAVLNGIVCGILDLAVLPFLEHVMNASTKFRLLELSDLNSPILKRMLSLAPGTYTHSMSVANLAENACREIEANALLARVGAYYHDIGKIDQAEYFIENQDNYNKHDELKPGLSSSIIKSHVKIGVELASKLGLPEEVIDIIAQHHGSGIIRVFYQRALDLEDDDSQASIEDYSYAGSPPRSKEAAVVLLADSIEAASRVLKKPSVAALEKCVASIFQEKIESGQIHDSALTLRELDIVRKSFVKVLAGSYHSRIQYPKVKELQR